MKNFVAIMMMLGLAAGFLHAQPPQGKGRTAPAMKQKMKDATPEERAEQMTNQMAEKLTLTAEQRKKVYEINLVAAKANEPLIKQMDAAKEQIRQNNQRRKEALEQVLTEEQKAKMEEQQNQRKEQMQQRQQFRREEWRERTREK